MKNTDCRYHCPKCDSSEIKEAARFCKKFSRTLTEDEQKKAKHTYKHHIFTLTKECKWVYQDSNFNCIGFKPA